MTYDITKLIPRNLREEVKADGMPIYRVHKPEYDRLPLDTFLISTVMGTEGKVPESVLRIVKPNVPKNYPPSYRTRGDRLLYCCWSNGYALRKLIEPQQDTYRHIVLPDDPRHDMIAAFKLACDSARAMNAGRVLFPGTLLYRALGLDNDANPFWDILEPRAARRDRPVPLT